MGKLRVQNFLPSPSPPSRQDRLRHFDPPPPSVWLNLQAPGLRIDKGSLGGALYLGTCIHNCSIVIIMVYCT